jgi:hypothetical protein
MNFNKKGLSEKLRPVKLAKTCKKEKDSSLRSE